jgi:hypothetical protein
VVAEAVVAVVVVVAEAASDKPEAEPAPQPTAPAPAPEPELLAGPMAEFDQAAVHAWLAAVEEGSVLPVVPEGVRGQGRARGRAADRIRRAWTIEIAVRVHQCINTLSFGSRYFLVP